MQLLFLATQRYHRYFLPQDHFFMHAGNYLFYKPILTLHAKREHSHTTIEREPVGAVIIL